MSRPEFETQTMISAVSSKSVEVIIGTSVIPIPVGTYENIKIYSPKGTVSTLFNITQLWDSEAGAFTGEKRLYLNVELNDSRSIGMYKFHGLPGNLVKFDQGEWYNATTKNPSDISAMISQMKSTKFDDKRAVVISFFNNSDKPLTSLREWILFVEREVVSR